MGPTKPHIKEQHYPPLNHRAARSSQEKILPKPTTPESSNKATGAQHKQRHHSFSSSSDEMELEHQESRNDWQQIWRTKRQRLQSSLNITKTFQTTTQNRFETLIDDLSPRTNPINLKHLRFRNPLRYSFTEYLTTAK